MTAQTWKDADISLDPVRGQKIAVIGYGIQGEAQANNMKDSGLEVIVGLKEGGASWKKAEADGHRVASVAEATREADIVHVLIPDMVQGPGCIGSRSGRTFRRERRCRFPTRPRSTGGG